jgi:hypothetical protein
MEILVFLKMWGNPKSSTFSRCFFMGKPMILWHPNIDGWWWLQLFGGYGTTRIWHTHLLQWNTSTQTTWKCKIFVDTLYGFDHVEPLDIIWNVCFDPQALWLTRQIVPTCNCWESSVWVISHGFSPSGTPWWKFCWLDRIHLQPQLGLFGYIWLCLKIGTSHCRHVPD